MYNAIRVSKRIGVAALALLAVALLSGLSNPVCAQGLPDRAVVTFDRPVEVPGKVLPAGTYLFRTIENDELVLVYSADQKQLFATVTVVPEERPSVNAGADCFIQLQTTRADAPQEVEAFFLPGRANGFQFIYPAVHVKHGHSL